MARLGWYLLLFGAGSAVLHFLEREFVVLMWIETWGDAAAWAIRVALVVLGVLLMLAARQPAQEQHHEAPAANPLIR